MLVPLTLSTSASGIVMGIGSFVVLLAVSDEICRLSLTSSLIVIADRGNLLLNASMTMPPVGIRAAVDDEGGYMRHVRGASVVVSDW